MKSTKFKTKTEKGITLIALIITIVVLLILAVVAINSIQNDGILSHTGNVANTYNQSVQNEAEQLQNYLDYLNKANGGTKTYTAYTIGQEVKLKDQTKETGTFYVIADSDETNDTVVLLTKECIDTATLLQSSSANKIAFSETNYWSTIEGITYPYVLKEEGQPDTSHYAARAAYDYGKKISGQETGRLIRLDEINKLTDVILNGKQYWTSTVGRETGVWFREGNVGINGLAEFNLTFLVRPVVEISKDLVELVTAE